MHMSPNWSIVVPFVQFSHSNSKYMYSAIQMRIQILSYTKSDIYSIFQLCLVLVYGLWARAAIRIFDIGHWIALSMIDI